MVVGCMWAALMRTRSRMHAERRHLVPNLFCGVWQKSAISPVCSGGDCEKISARCPHSRTARSRITPRPHYSARQPPKFMPSQLWWLLEAAPTRRSRTCTTARRRRRHSRRPSHRHLRRHPRCPRHQGARRLPPRPSRPAAPSRCLAARRASCTGSCACKSCCRPPRPATGPPPRREATTATTGSRMSSRAGRRAPCLAARRPRTGQATSIYSRAARRPLCFSRSTLEARPPFLLKGTSTRARP